jgi:uncharacterized protein (TIGR02217 family)
MAFLEIRFPCGISSGSTAGPERKTEVVVLGSGFEERNARWANSRRNYNAGYGTKTLNDLNLVIGFFEEVRGKLFGFRWKDDTDWKSCPPLNTISNIDQNIGTGDGTTVLFQLRKRYGSGSNYWYRDIKKPVAGTVVVAVNGVAKTLGTQFTVDSATGIVNFISGNTTGVGLAVTAGFEFDVPVRFDTDRLEINLGNFKNGSIPSIPVTEIRV